MEEEKKGDEKNSGELEKTILEMKKELEGIKGDKAKLLADVEKRDADLMSPQYLAFLEKGAHSDEKEIDSKGVDYEDMSKAQLVDLLSKQRDEKIKDIDGVFNKKIDSLTDKISLAFAQLDLRISKTDNPDFKWEDHKEKFFQKAKENPTWNANKVIKDINRDLKDEAETKSADDKAKEEEEHKALTEKAGTVVTDSAQQKTISKGEAAEAAYREAFGNKE